MDTIGTFHVGTHGSCVLNLMQNNPMGRICNTLFLV